MTDQDPIALLETAANRVRDPLSGRGAWLAGLVREPRVDAGTLRFEVAAAPEHSPEDRRAIVEAIVANLRGLGVQGPIEPVVRVRGRARPAPTGSDPVPGMSGPGLAPHGGPIVKARLPGVKHVVAVASGKGGVGKSTISTNLAVGLRKLGLSVGFVDADIHGPSLPIMMNVTTRPAIAEDKRVIPVMSYGVKCISMGLLVEPTEAMIWRGPMVMGVLRQFLQQTAWGDLDVLVVDLPPGTGDAQLTLIQAVELSGAVIVTTPQEVALADAVRGIEMFRRLNVPLLGLVENMAWYVRPDGSRDPVFGEGGGKRTAEDYDTPLLAQVPLRTSIRKSADAGLPAVLGQGEDAEVFRALASRVASSLGLAIS